MDYLTDNVLSFLSIVLPVIASLCVMTVIAVNIYLKIRRRISTKVNCWFCNEWTKVHYDNRNSFDCPTCLQYNGFDVDGGYNKIIPAQRDELLNHQPFPPHTRKNVHVSNGLCRICNNNQQLKVYQLANFVPLNEDKFDIEIEHFRTQLEKAYKLCKYCDNVVKQTITHQNTWLLGLKLSTLKKQGLSLLDLENSFNGLAKNTKQSYFLYFVNFIIIFFTLMILINAVYSIDFSIEVINKHFPSYVVPYIFLVKNILNFVLNAIGNIFSNIAESNEYKGLEKSLHLPEKVLDIKDSLVNLASNDYFKSEKLHYIKQYINANAKTLIPTRPDLYYVCFSGLLMQAVDYTLNMKKKKVTKFMQMLLWVVHIASWGQYSEETAFFTNVFQIVASLSMLYYTCVIKEIDNHEVQKLNKCNVFLTKSSEYTSSGYASIGKYKKSLKTSGYMQSISDTDTAESDCSNESIISTSTKKSSKIKGPLTIFNCLNKGNYVFGQAALFGNINKSALSFEELNASSSESHKSFVTTKSRFTEKSNETVTQPTNFDIDINKCLDNLHLSSLQNTSFSSICKQNVIVNTDIIRPRPILSPAKLKNINQNSWTAGGFWKNYKSPSIFEGNLSRSSSQTSGFVSQCNEPVLRDNKFNSLPPSRNNSTCGDFERSSLMSEPAYHCTLTEHNLRERRDDVLDFKPINNLDGRMYSSSASLQNSPTKINDYLRDLNGSMYSTNYNTGKIRKLTANLNPKENFPTINKYDRFKSSMEITNNFINKNDKFANDFCNLSVRFDNINKTNPFKPLKEL